MICDKGHSFSIIYYGDLMLGIIKGDNRYYYLANMMDCIFSSKLDELYNIDSLLLPFKGVDSSGIIFGTDLNLEDILKQNSIKYIFTGNSNNKLENLKKIYGFILVEILKDDTFVRQNAFLTAKGIIDYLNSGYKELSDLSILVIGYGNIGYYLAKLLNSYRAKFDVLSFNEMEKKYVSLANYNLVKNVDCFYDIIINTIPFNIDIDYLKLKGSRIIDVASFPYGFNHKEIDEYKLNYELLSAIPSKFAPMSAAYLVKNVIDKHISSWDYVINVI